jgi:hypothetical protein
MPATHAAFSWLGLGRQVINSKLLHFPENENHRLLSPSEMHFPQVAQRPGLLVAPAAFTSRIWFWPICLSLQRSQISEDL